MSDDANNSFIRWQDRLIIQLGYINNLLIGLSAAFLAFFFQVKSGESNIFSRVDLIFILLLVTLFFLSFIIGIIVAWNRLRSFRYTAKIARKRERDDRKNIDNLRKKTGKIDNWTWYLLNIQVGSFTLGVIIVFSLIIFDLI